ncbi:MAG: hypothetical protein LGR52_13335 [Candidatus Thiosymbion ectosymbiont of Robbea hypermnestra]|nr:hypothetical protein [Candidatus Thiosymbion ectosymbiont of Robbea hypermnestra]
MTIHVQPISEVTQHATNVLIREIGVVDTIRFLSQFRAGTGSYTEEREQLFKGMSVKDIIADIKLQQRKDHQVGYYDGLQPTEDNLNLNDPPGSNIEPTSQDSRQSKDSSNDS